MDGCGKPPVINKYLGSNINKFDRYGINDTVKLISSTGQYYQHIVSNVKHDFQLFSNGGMCPPPDELAEYKFVEFSNSGDNKNMKYGIYSTARECNPCCTDFLNDNVIITKFNDITFFYELPHTYYERDSSRYSDGYYYRSKFINGVQYDSVYECRNTFCTINKKTNKYMLLTFNRKFGIIRIQLDSNDYYDRTN